MLDSLSLLGARDRAFDVVAVLPRHLEPVAVIEEWAPDLRMVIDHLAKPPIMEGEMEPWRTRMTACAACPNVFETNKTIAHLDQRERDAVLGGTAARVYRLSA